jgi:hypothetical protein
MSIFKKHIRLISLVLLSVQVFIFGITVFHHHNFHSSGYNEISFSDYFGSNKFADTFTDENGQCRIIEFVHSTYSSYSQIINPDLPPNHFVFFNPAVEDQHYRSLILSYHTLRAPPLS